MEYIDTRFTRPWRRLVFYLFVLLFCILAPIIVMYASGYRWDFKNGFLKEIGVVSIDVLPEDVSVTMNGLVLKDKVPIRLSNVAPKNYEISISALGYKTWNKDILVQNKQTSYIKDVQLIREAQPNQVMTGAYSALMLSPDGQYLAALSTDTKTRLQIINTKDRSVVASSTVSSQSILSWSPKDNWLAIADNLLESDRIMLMSPANTTTIWTVQAPRGGAITKYLWQTGSETQLYFSTKKDIYAAKPNIRKIIRIGENAWLDWTARDGKVWALNKTHDQWEIVTDVFGFVDNHLTFTPDNLSANTPKNAWRLTANHGGLAVVEDTGTKRYYVVSKNDYKIINGEKWLLSPYNNWWLFWNKFELTSYQPGEEPFLLVRSGENLRDVVPLDKYNTLALVWGEKINILFPYYSVFNTLIDTTVSATAVNTADRSLYFAGTINNQPGIWNINY